MIADAAAACACASTPTATATSRSGSRAGTRAAASCTPAAARPAGALVRQLSARPRRATPNVEVLEDTRAADLWRRRRPRASASSARTAARSRARGTILATGGAAALWSRTTNPPGSIGIGLLLALAAGAALADLEFVQFHPTAVTGVPGREGFLVTEAIRGEGATLHGPDGERFVEELAPRDEVARAIWERDAARPASPSVALDMRARRPGALPERRRGAARVGPRPDDASSIPVAPAAHYVMGGVVDRPRTARRRRRASTSSASRRAPGLHGANRLASNSLSECVVFGARAARAALDEPASPPRGDAAAGAEPLELPRARRARRCGATPASCATARASSACSRTRTRSRGSSPRCALLREETRGAHVRTRLPADATPDSTACTRVVRDGDARLRALGL